MGSFMTITVIINNWFEKNRGLVTGITMSVSSLVGIIMNPVLNWVIENASWRVGCGLKGGIVLCTIPLVWLFIRLYPHEKGAAAWAPASACSVPSASAP